MASVLSAGGDKTPGSFCLFGVLSLFARPRKNQGGAEGIAKRLGPLKPQGRLGAGQRLVAATGCSDGGGLAKVSRGLLARYSDSAGLAARLGCGCSDCQRAVRPMNRRLADGEHYHRSWPNYNKKISEFFSGEKRVRRWTQAYADGLGVARRSTQHEGVAEKRRGTVNKAMKRHDSRYGGRRRRIEQPAWERTKSCYWPSTGIKLSSSCGISVSGRRRHDAFGLADEVVCFRFVPPVFDAIQLLPRLV